MKLFMILFLLLFNFGILCYGDISNLVWNGTAVSPEKYPNVPRLHPIILKRSKGKPYINTAVCTGSIISPRHILTVAHCVRIRVKVDEEYAILRVPGIIVDFEKIDPNGGGTKLLLKEHGIVMHYFFHKDWSFSKAHLNDIAIIEFPEGTNFGVTPMVLAKNYVEGDNDIAITVGYGDTNPDPNIKSLPTSLIEAEVPVIKDCIWKNINDKIICAGTNTTRVDHGDSGGPLIIKRNDVLYQIGIVHSGSKTNGTIADDGADFGIYTRVSSYCVWIKVATKNEAKCVKIPPAVVPAVAPAPLSLPIPSALNDTATPPNGHVGMSYQLFYQILCFIFTIIFTF